MKNSFLTTALCLFICSNQSSASCDKQGLNVLVLGSGGPEMVAERASSGYLFREGKKAVFLIDFGRGAAMNFARAHANSNDLKAVLFTHFHVDHSADFPALIKASYFEDRETDLPVLGPSGNALMPDVRAWLESLFGSSRGAYRYLSEYLDEGDSSYKLRPESISAEQKNSTVFRKVIDGFEISAIPVTHGPIPALAYRIQRDGCSVTFSGDTNNQTKTLERLAINSNLLIAHNAVPEDASPAALSLHMPPSEITRAAAAANVGQLVLSHIMKRTESRQAETREIIEKEFKNKVSFAKDLDVYPLRESYTE